jgi:hypothetical protein
MATAHELTDRSFTVADRWTYVWAARRRPYVHPLLSLHGAELTCNAPDDHPWHHGLWFTVKYVNDENFWEEYDEYGVLRHEGAPLVQADGGQAHAGQISVEGTLQWVRPDRETVVIDEHRRLTHTELGGAYAVDFETTLAPRTDVVLDRTPFTTWGGYGGLTVRGQPAWTDTTLMLDDGVARQQVHGLPSRWCNLAGEVDGRQAGIAMLDHPDNPRHPVPWYASTRAETYGEGWANFVNAAFLWDGPMTFAAGAALRFRYQVLVHDGTWDRDAVEAAHRAFVT